MKYTIRNKAYGLCLAACIGALSAHAQGTITTIAGTGLSGYSGDGGSAVAAAIGSPVGVCADHSGNIYLIDYNHIRKINTSTGIISTVPVSSSSYGIPSNIWIDHNTNLLYVADHIHDQIHQVNPTTGAVVNVCGDGGQGSNGDGGPAVSARTMIPGATCLDAAGNIYLADRGNNKIRKIDALTGIITTIAGTGSAGFYGDGGSAITAKLSQPMGVCVDRFGNVYISDYGNNRIRKITASSGIITTIAGTGVTGYTGDAGPAIAATINHPSGLAIDQRGNLYIADQGNNVVRVVNNFGYMHTAAGTGAMGYSGDGGVANLAQLNQPNAVWLDDAHNLLIADQNNHRIRKVSSYYYSAPRIGNNGVIPDEDVTVFPNPSAGTFTLNVAAEMVNGTVEVMNAIGKKVYTASVSDTQSEISLNQPSGIYFVCIKSDAGKVTKRIVISN